MRNPLGSRLALAAGFLAAAVAYGAFCASQTALNPEATGEVADTVLASPLVHDSMVEQLQEQVQQAAATETLNPQIAAAVEQAISDPEFLSAFSEAITTLHRGILEGYQGEITIDVTKVTTALQTALADVDPALAAQLSQIEPITIDLGDEEIPALSNADSRAKLILVIATILAIALLALGVAMHDSQRKAFARVGRRVAFLAIGPAIAFIVVPKILAGNSNEGVQLAGSVLEVYGGRVLPSAAVLAIAGLLVWLTTILWPKPAAVDSPLAARTPEPPNPYATTSAPAALADRTYL